MEMLKKSTKILVTVQHWQMKLELCSGTAKVQKVTKLFTVMFFNDVNTLLH